MSSSGLYKQADPVMFPSRIIMRGVRAWLLVEDSLQAATRRKVAKSARTKRHHTQHPWQVIYTLFVPCLTSIKPQ